MFRRGTIFFGLLAASVVVPYITTHPPKTWLSAFSGWGSSSNDQAQSGMAPNAVPGAANPYAPGAPGRPQRVAGLEGPPVSDLAEVIRFDATPAWVIHRWSRVSTAAAAPDLQGYRVALVTGTREDDLAGSLTYYFNRQQRVQKITFTGTTGDARRLIALVTARYGFEQQSADPSMNLYQVKWNGRPLSELQIRPVRVVRSDAAHARYDVALEINNQAR